jgi:hypothetical protein
VAAFRGFHLTEHSRPINSSGLCINSNEFEKSAKSSTKNSNSLPHLPIPEQRCQHHISHHLISNFAANPKMVITTDSLHIGIAYLPISSSCMNKPKIKSGHQKTSNGTSDGSEYPFACDCWPVNVARLVDRNMTRNVA